MSNWPKFRRSKDGVDTIISHAEALELIGSDAVSFLTRGTVRQIPQPTTEGYVTGLPWFSLYTQEDALKDAAPELLEALIAAKECLSTTMVTQDSFWHNTEKKINEAIKKARGE